MISASAVYGWVPALAGLGAALLLALAGLQPARAWSSQALSLIVVVAVGVSWQAIGADAGVDASVVAAFILVLALACGRLFRARREWVALSVVALSVLWLYQLAAAVLVAPATDTGALTAATLAVVVGSSVLAWAWSALGYRTRGGAGYLTSAAGPYGLPVLALSTREDYGQGFVDVVLGALALALAGTYVLDAATARSGGRARRLPAPIRATFWALAAAYLLALTLQHTSGSAQIAAVLAQALVLGVLSRGSRTRTSFFTALAFTLAGMLQLFEAMPLRAFRSRYETSQIATWPIALSAALLLVGAVSSLGAAARLFPRALGARRSWLAYLPVGWYALIGAAIVGCTRLFDGTATVADPDRHTDEYARPACPSYGDAHIDCGGGPEGASAPPNADVVAGVDGFLVGIMVATLLLALVSFVLLALFLNGRDGFLARTYHPAYRCAGLLTLAVAVGKVVVIDTTSLDTLYRVGAYLGTGLLLMGLGARFGRQLTSARSPSAVSAPVPATHADTGNAEPDSTGAEPGTR